MVEEVDVLEGVLVAVVGAVGAAMVGVEVVAAAVGSVLVAVAVAVGSVLVGAGTGAGVVGITVADAVAEVLGSEERLEMSPLWSRLAAAAMSERFDFR